MNRLFGKMYIYLSYNKTDYMSDTKLIPGKQVAEYICNSIKQKLVDSLVKPKLAIILASYDESSKIYVDLKSKKAEEVGIEPTLFWYTESITTQELILEIQKLNADSSTHGILLQLPLYPHLENDTEKIVNTIDFKKDVDGLTAYQQGLCSQLSKEAILPATVEAILECMQFTTKNTISWSDKNSSDFQTFLRGKTVVIVNDSNLIGRPLAMLLNAMGATTIICNEYTKKIKDILITADYAITATGKAHLFNHEFLKPNAIVIDVTSIKTQNGVKGDFIIDQELLEKVEYVTPVPGGVGPLTIACLLRNVINAIG